MFTRRRLVIGGSITFLTRGESKAQQTAAGPYSDLFVWARPISLPGIPWDHTWVTTYDNSKFCISDIQAIVAAESRLVCLGDFTRRVEHRKTHQVLDTSPASQWAGKCILTLMLIADLFQALAVGFFVWDRRWSVTSLQINNLRHKRPRHTDLHCQRITW